MPVSKDDFRLASEFYHALPTPWLEPEDVAELVFLLASDASTYMTGTSIQVAQRSGPVNLPSLTEAWSSYMTRRPTEVESRRGFWDDEHRCETRCRSADGAS